MAHAGAYGCRDLALQENRARPHARTATVSLLARWLLISFIESFATTLIERGLYFYSEKVLKFTSAENLWLALGFGVAYAAGALVSHPLSKRLPEKSLLVLSIVGQIAGHLALFVWPGAYALVAVNPALGFFNGLKWPLVESYVNAGQTPTEAARTVGRFNMSWVTAVFVGLLASGPLIGLRPPGNRAIFLVAAALNAVSLWLLRPVHRTPGYLPADHPERPTPEALGRLRAILLSSRWTMFMSYCLMWILAALLPHIYEKLRVPVSVSPALSGVLDLVRGAAFCALQYRTGWHHRRLPLVAAMVGVPVGFFVTIFGPHLAVVLVGELVFGAAAGLAYYAALYYAMVVKNAAVDAGGAHEGLIGSGFAVGPLMGLLGVALAPTVGGELVGMFCGVGPLVAVCAVGAMIPLARLRRLAA
jgi:MFS family permease